MSDPPEFPLQITPELTEREQKQLARKAKASQAARLRYQNLSDEQKKELNKKRTLQQKRKRQREKEMAELEEILRQSGDIVDDPILLEIIAAKKRARWAEASKKRYQQMDEEERRAYNKKRRGSRKLVVKNDPDKSLTEPIDEAAALEKIRSKNAKKAEAARLRYHSMTAEEKRAYNQRRTEFERKRRAEEQALLSTPIGEITAEDLERAKQIVARNVRHAAQARARYQNMTPEERKAYNEKRRKSKKKKSPTATMDDDSNVLPSTSGVADAKPAQKQEQSDILSLMERDLDKQITKATKQEALAHQQQMEKSPPPHFFGEHELGYSINAPFDFSSFTSRIETPAQFDFS